MSASFDNVLPSKIRVGVLRGGPSSEYDVSLESGGFVLKNLKEKYHPCDILISKRGEWHFNGRVKKPEQILPAVDVVFNALHGEYGEDGKIQQLFKLHAFPHTGPETLGAAMSMNKVLAKGFLKDLPIKTPRHVVVSRDEYSARRVREIFSTFPHPSVVKPVSGGSSVGVYVTTSFHSLKEALEKTLAVSSKALVEEYISGKEATCGVIEKFREQELYPLLPVEIRYSEKGTFFDYEEKYSGKAEEICPGNFTREESDLIQEGARCAHKRLGLRDYSRSDFIIHPTRGIYLLEVNSLPGLAPRSLMPLSVEAVGSSMPEFVDHVVTLALGRK